VLVVVVDILLPDFIQLQITSNVCVNVLLNTFCDFFAVFDVRVL